MAASLAPDPVPAPPTSCTLRPPRPCSRLKAVGETGAPATLAASAAPEEGAWLGPELELEGEAGATAKENTLGLRLPALPLMGPQPGEGGGLGEIGRAHV